MSVAAFQESVRVVGVIAEAAKFVGILGAWVSSGALVVALTGLLCADAFRAASDAATV